ncbi:hypothetical protein GmHk_20G056906 [Glycine max]|nr:hypothetical protein GmHk_20G056906 [Glycine max]
MQRRSIAGDLIPIDLEINATCRRHNQERIRNFLQDLEAAAIPKEEPQSSEASSSFPIAGHSHLDPIEDHIMAEEPRRVTLEDYSDGLRPQSKQLLDAFAGGKIKLKTPEEAMDLIENMATSDIAILRDRAHIPTKKSLLELTSQDALLAQNKLLSKQLKALTETLSKLPTQIHSAHNSYASVLQVAGCTICGGAHESGCCILIKEKTTYEVNYMRNQPRKNFNAGGFSGFQHGQQYNQHQGQWRNHLGNQFNRDQGGPSTRPQQQGPSLYDRTTKLEETLA